MRSGFTAKITFKDICIGYEKNDIAYSLCVVTTYYRKTYIRYTYFRNIFQIAQIQPIP